MYKGKDKQVYNKISWWCNSEISKWCRHGQKIIITLIKSFYRLSIVCSMKMIYYWKKRLNIQNFYLLPLSSQHCRNGSLPWFHHCCLSNCCHRVKKHLPGNWRERIPFLSRRLMIWYFSVFYNNHIIIFYSKIFINIFDQSIKLFIFSS